MGRPLPISLVLITAGCVLAQGKTPEKTEIERLVRQLGSNSFAEREGAVRELSQGDEDHLPPLKHALAAATDPEVTGRLKRVITAIEKRCYGPKAVFGGPQRLDHSQIMRAVAISADGKFVLTGRLDRRVSLWDTATGKEVRRFENPISAHSVAFSPDGRFAVASDDGSSGQVQLWEVATGKVVRSFNGHKSSVYGLDYSADGKRLATASFDGTVRIWDAATGKELRQMKCVRPADNQHARLWSVAFSPDRRRVISCGDDCLVTVWDVESGAETHQLKGHRSWVFGVAFAPDGKHVASCAEGGEAYLWSLEKETLVRKFVGHERDVHTVRFSPNGKRLLTSGLDKTMRLWDVTTGKEIRRFEGHTDFVSQAFFSADGRYAVTCGHDCTAILWRLPR